MTRVVAAALLTALALGALATWLQRELPAPEVAIAVAAPAQSVRVLPPVAARSQARRRVAPGAPKPAPVEEPLVSLDELLRIPQPEPSGPQSVEWQRAAKTSGAQPAAPPRRIHVDYSRKKVLEDAARQAERRQTDVGVTVRVDEADTVRLRGGVRVDETDRGEPEPDREATPNVGVEVRF
jgi:hypothetical protein